MARACAPRAGGRAGSCRPTGRRALRGPSCWATERRLREQELDRLSREDTLTGVLNRRGFAATADAALDEAQLDGSDVHLVVADVDGLKSINDEWGHEYGDRALVTAAAALRHVYGPDGCIGRLGGAGSIDRLLALADENQYVAKRAHRATRPTTED